MKFGEFLFYLIAEIGVLWGIYIFFSMLESSSGTPSGEKYDDPRGLFEWGSLPNYLLILFILCLLAFVCFGG